MSAANLLFFAADLKGCQADVEATGGLLDTSVPSSPLLMSSKTVRVSLHDTQRDLTNPISTELLGETLRARLRGAIFCLQNSQHSGVCYLSIRTNMPPTDIAMFGAHRAYMPVVSQLLVFGFCYLVVLGIACMREECAAGRG